MDMFFLLTEPSVKATLATGALTTVKSTLSTGAFTKVRKSTKSSEKQLKFDSGISSCTICFSEYKDDDRVSKFKCNHFFHERCIKTWLSSSNSCPVCRRDLELVGN